MGGYSVWTQFGSSSEHSQTKHYVLAQLLLKISYFNS